MNSNTIFSLPKLSDRQKEILDACLRVDAWRTQRLVDSMEKNRLTAKFAGYGYINMLAGNVPDEIKADVRVWLKESKDVCRKYGLDPDLMFSNEIIECLSAYQWKAVDRIHNACNKAAKKLRDLALKENVSALKLNTSLIGSRSVPHLKINNDAVLLLTQEDKQKLYDAKVQTGINLISSINTLKLGKVRWFKGYEMDSEDSSELEFLEHLQLATWIDFDVETVHYYSKKVLESHGSAQCNMTPTPVDDTRSWSCNIQLFTSFEQDEYDGWGVSYLTFSVCQETAI